MVRIDVSQSEQVRVYLQCLGRRVAHRRRTPEANSFSSNAAPFGLAGGARFFARFFAFAATVTSQAAQSTRSSARGIIIALL